MKCMCVCMYVNVCVYMCTYKYILMHMHIASQLLSFPIEHAAVSHRVFPLLTPLILYKLHCLGVVWIMRRQRPLPTPRHTHTQHPQPQFSLLKHPLPSPKAQSSMFVCTHMNEHGSGFTPMCVHAHPCVCTCAAVFIMCMLEGDTPRAPNPIYSPLPPTLHTSAPFAFQIYCNGTSLPSFAFAISCYGNKGTDWSGCSSESETQGEETERDFLFFFACKSWS